jgi:hypothetical protein
MARMPDSLEKHNPFQMLAPKPSMPALSLICRYQETPHTFHRADNLLAHPIWREGNNTVSNCKENLIPSLMVHNLKPR